MRVLVWQWGRRGAGPRFAVELTEGLRLIPGTEALLSLSTGAEIMHGPMPPQCALPVATYTTVAGLAWRLAQGPVLIPNLLRRLVALKPDVAICAMPGPLDLRLMVALRLLGVPVVVVVHDADAHLGDVTPMLMMLQRMLTRRAYAVAVLSDYVKSRLAEQRLVDARKLFIVSHPPFTFGPLPPPPRAHGGPLRLLFFGRLLPYKGLDLLAEAVRLMGGQGGFDLRVVGHGPECAALAALRALPAVTVQNRWVPEDEIGALIAWADVLVLPYREASQSGIAPAAIAAGRLVVATRVGGLTEQLRDQSLARLCSPDAVSLAAILCDVLQAQVRADPDLVAQDPRLAWRDVAERLLRQVATLGLQDADPAVRARLAGGGWPAQVRP